MITDRFRRSGNLLRSDGTNQQQRLLPGLESDYVMPDERSFADLVEYARRVAGEIRFYDLSGQATGDWRPFLEPLTDAGTGTVTASPALEALLDARADWPPHLVLFLAFLRLFQHVQTDLNGLPQRHLLYYYSKALGLPRRPPVADDVHVVFEPAKNAAPTPLPAGTRLDAGKDAKGRPLSYATQAEVVVSQATIGGIRRFEMEQDVRKNRRVFVAEDFSALEGSSHFTFGSRQLDRDPSQRYMTEAPLGFGVAAPILALAEGERTVTIVADLQLPSPAPPVVTQGIGYALDVALTGAKGWLTPDHVDANLQADGGEGHPVLTITLKLSTAAAAVVSFDAALHGPGPSTGRPMLRCLVKGETGIYEVLDGLRVEKVDLSVSVKGVRDLVVQGADGPLNVNQAMTLFGGQPRIGATFYIGSAEVFSKRLTSFDLHLDWKGPPPDLFDHYRAYFDHTDPFLTDNFDTLFRADVDLLYERTFRTVLPHTQLFAPVSTQQRVISAEPSAIDSAFAGVDYEEQPDLVQPEGFDASSRFGFARIVLNEPTRSDLAIYSSTVPFDAFGHSAFARRYANQAIALSQWKPADGPKPLLPNEPYTPVLSTLSIDYTAAAELQPGDRHATGAFFTLGPFGATPASERTPPRLVPLIEGDAALLLGVDHLQPPANLSMFFQIDIGTASGDQVLQSSDIEWDYLGEGDAWQRLSASAVLVETTQGFQKPGIVSVAIPRDATLDHTSLPSGLVWLRALISSPPESAARTLFIKPHAALARFQPGALPLEEYKEHLLSGLPAGVITKLAERNATIKKVSQPNPSFDGRGEESVPDYVRRCSERLRHRRRAVTGWDFERLVLEAFPEVFKVKCLRHTDETGTFNAGHAALVIVPDLRRTGGTNVLEPRAGAVLMERISAYVDDVASPFSTVHVIHPVFERIRVEAHVVFIQGRDPGYYAGVLNEDLRRFLSPWAYEEGEDIQFGTRIYRSEILTFIEGRVDYVDHVTDLKLYHSFDGPPRDGIGFMKIGVDFFIRANPRPAIHDMRIGDDFVVGRDVEVAETTLPHAIIVSHPEHLITPVAAGTEACPGIVQLGIGYMTVGMDFNVQPDAV